MSNTAASVAPPAPTGGLFIPAIDHGVPTRFSKDLQRSEALARFARAAECVGVPLPTGSFLDIEQVVAAQWGQFLATNYSAGVFDGVAGAPVLNVTDEALQIVITAESTLNAFQLKPVVERLETAAPGLGWFVESVLTSASYHGHQIYDMGMVTYMLDVYHGDLDEFTDEAYARSLILQNGGEPDGQVTPEEIAQMKEEFGFWPSDILAQAGGHEHLLHHWSSRARKPKVMNERAAAKWLKANRAHALAAVVDAGLRLHRALKKDPTRDFVWDGHEDDTETMGAHCFLCWDVPDLLFEAVSHLEQNQYSGGMAVEAFARRTVNLMEAGDEDLQDLAASAVEYFNRWELLGKLLSHFPIWDDDDET